MTATARGLHGRLSFRAGFFRPCSDLAETYFDNRAALKIIWFEQSAHNRPFEEPGEIQPGLDRRSLAVRTTR